MDVDKLELLVHDALRDVNSDDFKKLKINDKEKFQIKMQNRHSELKKLYPMVFNILCSDDTHNNNILFMIQQLKKIKKGDITEHQASIGIGTILRDQYVMPLVHKKKEKKENN